MYLEAMALEIFNSAAAAEKLPHLATVVNTFMLINLSIVGSPYCFVIRNNM
jgi:hypothetical protein